MRRVFVNLVLLSFIVGSAYDTITDQEHWPFSQYPMFSGVWTSSSFTWLRLFGVTADGREFPLDANRFVAPFDQSRLPKSLKQMLEQRDGQVRIRTALPDLYRRYEQLRLQDRHDGPALVALRLYELEWVLHADAANVDAPERRQLVAEIRP